MVDPADNARTLDEYERLMELDTKGAHLRQDLRDKIQARALENADAILGQANQQQAMQIARELLSDPTQ